MHKKKKLIFSAESLDAIANKAHAKIDYTKITQKILKELPALINKAIRADLDDIVKSFPKAKDGKDGQDGKEGLSHQEKKQIRADVTRDIQENIKIPTLDEIGEILAGNFVSKGLLKNRMDALTRFIKSKTPISAGISGSDMVEEITEVLGEDWQSGGAVDSVDGRSGIVTLGDLYEPVVSKNTAFNKNFGAGAGQVAEGNALAAKITGPGSSQINEIFTAVDLNGNAQMVPVTIDPVTRKVTFMGETEQDGDVYIKDTKNIYFTNTGKASSGKSVTISSGGNICRIGLGTTPVYAVEARATYVKIPLVSDSTGSNTGGFRVVGGASIAKNLHLGGNHFIHTVKSGATQGGAGAAIHEVWKTSGHATLPDNILMIGV